MGKHSSAFLLAVFLAAVFIPVSVASAARLDPVSVKEIHLVNGERVEPSDSPEGPALKATGDGVTTMEIDMIIDWPPEETDPLEASHFAEAQIQYRIEPEGDEVAGQCVAVDWSHQAQSSLEVTGGADGRLGVGGSSVSGSIDPLSLDFDGASEIVLAPVSGTPSDQFSYGPSVVGPSNPDIAVETDGSFLARIGDDIQMRLSTGAVAHVPPGDSLSANVAASMAAVVREGVVDCIEVSVGDVTKLEGDSGTTAFAFPVSVSSTPVGFSVTVQSADGSATSGEDYTAVGPTVLDFPRDGGNVQNVIVEVAGDVAVESDETFSLELSDVTSNVGLVDATGLGTILNDDFIGISVGDVTEAEGDSGITAFTFPVTVSSTEAEVSVTVQTADGTATSGEDYTALAPTVLTFNQGGATTQNVTVEISGDLAVEPDESFSVELSDPSSNAVLSDPSGQGTILDDDAFKATVTGTKEASGGMFPGGTVIYTIRLENSGPGLQQDNPGDEFVDVLPADLDLLGAAADSGTATIDTASNTVRWNGEIPAGGAVGLTIEAVLNESASFNQPISNHASINYDADGQGSNESSRLTDDPGTATSGDATVFHVHLPPGHRIPALDRTALAILALMMVLAGLVAVRR